MGFRVARVLPVVPCVCVCLPVLFCVSSFRVWVLLSYLVFIGLSRCPLISVFSMLHPSLPFPKQRLLAKQQKDRATELRGVLEDLFERRNEARAALIDAKEAEKASQSEINEALKELEVRGMSCALPVSHARVCLKRLLILFLPLSVQADFAEEQERQQRTLLNVLEVMHSRQQLLMKLRQDNETLEVRSPAPHDLLLALPLLHLFSLLPHTL